MQQARPAGVWQECVIDIRCDVDGDFLLPAVQVRGGHCCRVPGLRRLRAGRSGPRLPIRRVVLRRGEQHPDLLPTELSCTAVQGPALHLLPTAAAAQRAGYRACKRCRPDASPGSPEWSIRADVVGRAMRLIADGVVDRDGVTGLAARLGYSQRQLERQLLAELGAGPLALARAQRAQTARLLIESTTLPMGEVAMAAGFSSIRSFNDTVRAVFAMTPSQLRQHAIRGSGTAVGAITVRLPFRAPLAAERLLEDVAAMAIPGLEQVSRQSYRRTLRLPHGPGIVTLEPRRGHVVCRLAIGDLQDLGLAVSRCRWMLDLDADPMAADEALSQDDGLAPLVSQCPGRRVPHISDNAELVTRLLFGPPVRPGHAAASCQARRESRGAHRRHTRHHPCVPQRTGLVRSRPSRDRCAEAFTRLLQGAAHRPGGGVL